MNEHDTAKRRRGLSGAVCAGLLLGGGLSSCLGSGAPELSASTSSALSQSIAPTDDTFINSAFPDNNDGASNSIYTGQNGKAGVMRGLVRFPMPGALQGRVTVTDVQLTMTLRALGSGAPTAGIETLNAVTQAWLQGNGIGNTQMSFTVGQTCSSSVSGATWNQSDCAGAPGMGTTWTAAGGTVVVGASATASSPATVGAAVVWDSASAGNTAMNSDVQGWIDAPVSNHGWRITSSTEGTNGAAQRFYSMEDGTSPPSLAVSYTCKAGFAASGTGCTTCTAAANADCVVAKGNSCSDPGAPATTYSCTCSGAGYVQGTGADGNTACVLGCTPDHCLDGGDTGATCTPHPTGYGCTCSVGFTFNGVTCVSEAGVGEAGAESGSGEDSGKGSDSGNDADSGSAADAGSVADSGNDADSGDAADSGAASDAGSVVDSAGGPESDALTGVQEASVDGGSAGSGPGKSAGCGCRAVAAREPGWSWTLAALGAFALRRSRSRLVPDGRSSTRTRRRTLSPNRRTVFRWSSP